MTCSSATTLLQRVILDYFHSELHWVLIYVQFFYKSFGWVHRAESSMEMAWKEVLSCLEKCFLCIGKYFWVWSWGLAKTPSSWRACLVTENETTGTCLTLYLFKLAFQVTLFLWNNWKCKKIVWRLHTIIPGLSGGHNCHGDLHCVGYICVGYIWWTLFGFVYIGSSGLCSFLNFIFC